MRNEFYTETSNKLLFTAFDSIKERKTDKFRVHTHVELEIGFISSGEGDYIINGQHFQARDGLTFLVRPNDQHCIPTIFTPELVSFNLHITSYYLWHICSEYIDLNVLRMLIGGQAIQQCFEGRGEQILGIKRLCDDPGKNRMQIKFSVLQLLVGIANELDPIGVVTNEDRTALAHFGDIQKAIKFMNEHLSEQITIDDIAKSANLGLSQLNKHFRHITGASPYEYLILLRIERAIELLRSTDDTILDIACDCGFGTHANFSKLFRRITGITPSECRSMRKQ